MYLIFGSVRPMCVRVKIISPYLKGQHNTLFNQPIMGLLEIETTEMLHPGSDCQSFF